MDTTNDTNTFTDVYRCHLTVSGGQVVTSAPELVSRVGTTGAVGDKTSLLPGISTDGNLVSFTTTSSTLGAAGGWRATVVKNMTTGAINVVSRAEGASGAIADTNCTFPSMSRDGRYVGFRASYFSGAINIDPTYTPINFTGNQYIRDTVTGHTFRLASPAQTSYSSSPTGGINTAISDDGKVIAFDSDWNDLVPGDTNNLPDIFTFTWDGNDPSTGVITRVSVQDISQGGGQCLKTPFNAGDEYIGCANPSISGDGRWIVYNSTANNLDPLRADTNDANDVFVYDRTTRQTRRVSVAYDGTQGIGGSQGGRISQDGRFIIFQSNAPLSSIDTNGDYDEFVAPNPLYQ
jgi:Tol biopolymer transport system component